MGTIRNRPHSIHSGRLVAIEDDSSRVATRRIPLKHEVDRGFLGSCVLTIGLATVGDADYPGSEGEGRLPSMKPSRSVGTAGLLTFTKGTDCDRCS